MQHGIKGNQLLFLMWMSSDDLELANNGDAHFDKYDSNVAKAIVNIKDKYGFSDEDIARAFPGIDIEVIDEEGESPINE